MTWRLGSVGGGWRRVATLHFMGNLAPNETLKSDCRTELSPIEEWRVIVAVDEWSMNTVRVAHAVW